MPGRRLNRASSAASVATDPPPSMHSSQTGMSSTSNTHSHLGHSHSHNHSNKGLSGSSRTAISQTDTIAKTRVKPHRHHHKRRESVGSAGSAGSDSSKKSKKSKELPSSKKVAEMTQNKLHRHSSAFSVVHPSLVSTNKDSNTTREAYVASDRAMEFDAMHAERQSLLQFESPRVLAEANALLGDAVATLAPSVIPATAFHAHSDRPEIAATVESESSGNKRLPVQRVKPVGGVASARAALIVLPRSANANGNRREEDSKRKDSTRVADESGDLSGPGKHAVSNAGPVFGSAPAIADSTQFVDFVSSNGLFSGKLRADGTSISACELIVRSVSDDSHASNYRWNKGMAFTTRIGLARDLVRPNPDEPPAVETAAVHQERRMRAFHPPQLKSAFYYTRLAVGVIEDLRTLCGRIGSKQTVDDNIIVAAATMLSDAGTFLQMAMQAFLVRSSRTHSFPDGTDEPAARCFVPPLPRDLVIELSLQRRNLVITAYCLHILRAQDVDKASLRDSGIQRSATSPSAGEALMLSPVGRICQWSCCGEMHYVEVTDYGVAEVPVSALSETFATIAAVYDQCAELREKMRAFMS